MNIADQIQAEIKERAGASEDKSTMRTKKLYTITLTPAGMDQVWGTGEGKGLPRWRGGLAASGGGEDVTAHLESTDQDTLAFEGCPSTVEQLAAWVSRESLREIIEQVEHPSPSTYKPEYDVERRPTPEDAAKARAALRIQQAGMSEEDIAADEAAWDATQAKQRAYDLELWAKRLSR
jgi:hypothetical protein